MSWRYAGEGLCYPGLKIQARQLVGVVCVKGGVECPLIRPHEAESALEKMQGDPSVMVEVESRADEIPHFSAIDDDDYARHDPEEVFNRKRDLDVLQRLGLVPGSVRPARYLYELLFRRITTPRDICAHDGANWRGCPHAASGAYEGVRVKGWSAVVHARSADEMRQFRASSVHAIDTCDRLYIRAHHLMCLACGYAGGAGRGPRPNDTLGEILERIRRQPDVPITLVEGTCMACCCCDGFVPQNGRCVHAGGLIRDYKKDLDVFQKLDLMPGATLPARELYERLFDRIRSTREICGYGDGVVTSEEWTVCGGPNGHEGYAKTRESGIFG